MGFVNIKDYLRDNYNLHPNDSLHGCGCMGPQAGYPRCPCGMRGIVERNGRWIQLEVDLGPVIPKEFRDNKALGGLSE